MAAKGYRHRGLEALHKLRQFEFEKEQAELQRLKQEEWKVGEKLLQAKQCLDDAWGSEIQGGLIGGYGTRDELVRKNQADMEIVGRRFQVAQNASYQQAEITLLAKQEVEKVERILEKRREIWYQEEEVSERKLLDDLAQRCIGAEAAEIRYGEVET